MSSAARLSIMFLALSMLGLPGCGVATDPPRLATTPMQIGNKQFTVEIAANDSDRATGLMNRDSMALENGMIFVFADEAPRAFWMKSTRIPLDIVYINAGGEVVDIKTMQPFDLRAVPSAKPAKYAIELNAGGAAYCGVKIGDKLTIPAAASEPKN